MLLPTTWSILAACTPGDEVVVDLEASVAPSTHVPTVGWVTVSGAEGASFVEYGLDGAFDHRTPDGVHTLLGLKAGRSYDWRAVVIDADGVRHESEPGTFDTPLPPADLLPLTVDVAEPEAGVAYVLASVIRTRIDSWAAIVDRDGDYVWWAASGGTVMITPELGLDRASILWVESDFGKWDDVGQLERVALDGSARTETRLRLAHHDFAQNEDGTFTFLGQTFAEVDIGGQTIPMASDILAVVPEGATDADEPAVLFDQFRDFPLDPEPTCAHIADRDDRLGHQDVAEWTHANSLVYLPETGAYYVNDKFTDWLFAVDAATGEVRWVLNGRGSDFTTPEGAPVWSAVDQTVLWSHGHLSHLWDGGGLIFDNGDHHPGVPSRVMEFAYDEAARTAEVVWTFDHPEGLKTPALGDARRLANGNVLATWSGLGSLTEITPDGRIVWQATYPGELVDDEGQTIGRVVPIEDLYAPM